MIDDIITNSVSKKEKQLAVLVDPDKTQPNDLFGLIKNANACNVDYFFVGGSHVQHDRIDDVIV